MADYYTGDINDAPGWGGITDNPYRASFDPSQGVIDSGTWNTPGSGGFLGLTGSQWAGGLKDIGGDLKGAGVSPTGSAAQRPATAGSAAQAAAHTGQAGGLGMLLQLLAQKANLFNAAAHQGAVPTPTRPGGGLLGL